MSAHTWEFVAPRHVAIGNSLAHTGACCQQRPTVLGMATLTVSKCSVCILQ